jgi:hypothetical protein
MPDYYFSVTVNLMINSVPLLLFIQALHLTGRQEKLQATRQSCPDKTN